ncbi:methyltransferase family protein [Caproiciproducens sp. R2]|uniref:methyltransferase family protein n=1 Tax=Caproiciproducens sp. R2 TaxID=3435187 RepID=UPI0040334D7D
MYFYGDTYFPGPVLKNVFQILLIAVLLMETAILLLTARNNQKGEKRNGEDRGSMLLIIVGFWLSVLLNPLYIRLFPVVLPVPVFWLGFAAAVSGMILRLYSVWTLRKFFSMVVRVGSEQKIVQNGPYRLIRHPAYTGSILTLLGISLAFRSVLGIPATLLIAAAVYGYRIRTEEKALEKSFGAVYRDYEQRTWRLVPHVW